MTQTKEENVRGDGARQRWSESSGRGASMRTFAGQIGRTVVQPEARLQRVERELELRLLL